MSILKTRRLPLPRSLRWQFILAAAGLEILILAGGLTALYALRIATSRTELLAEVRLVQMQDAQDLVQRTLLIERESYQLASAESDDATLGSYADIVKELTMFDRLVDRLATAGDDIALLDLHLSSQLFRNTTNVAAQLRENRLHTAAKLAASAADRISLQRQLDATKKEEQQFHAELRRQASAMVTSAQIQSDHFTQNYRAEVRELAAISIRNQRWVTALLAGSVLLAWFVARSFLGRHVLARLQLVSQGLRQRDLADGQPTILVQGTDEIGEMARAVEQFQQDRQQLAQANAALQAEKIRQEELIGKLAEAHSQLLQSEKMASIGQLAAGVAHEINNPIAFVNTNLGVLQAYVSDFLLLLEAYEQVEASLTDDARQGMEDMKDRIDLAYLREDVGKLVNESIDGLQRVKRIVQDLKDFSHVDNTGKQWASLEKGLDSTLNVVWNELKYKADVVKEYGGIREIECLPSQLNQVFLNLLVNAAHAIETHGVITVRTGQDAEHVWVEVEDTGKGIIPENLERIFNPFFTTKPVGMGTGLGLSLSYGIVKKHGGQITVKSEVNKGSVFRVVLPQP